MDDGYLDDLADALLRHLLASGSRKRHRQAAQAASHHGPTNPLHQTWRGFAEDMQQIEAIARRERMKLTKTNVCQFGVDTVKTVTRTMRWYGLADTDWPPSTWDPNVARKGGSSGKNW